MKFVRQVPLIALLLVLAVTSRAQNKHAGQPEAQPADDTPRPQLVIESATHDFGELKSGTPLRYAFKIKNTGKADLVIESVSPG
jgi:hypothetical protein